MKKITPLILLFSVFLSDIRIYPSFYISFCPDLIWLLLPLPLVFTCMAGSKTRRKGSERMY